MWARGGLEHLAVTTFAVDPDRLCPLLLPGVEPETVSGADGAFALVSAVSFVARHLKVAGVPGARFSGGHVDYRAVVRTPGGERAVWFLGAAMSSPLAWGLRGLWSMPWHRAAVKVEAGDSYRVAVADHHWTAAIVAATGGTADHLDGFERIEQAADVLVNARLGLFRGRRGRLTAYRVEHSPPRPQVARVVAAKVMLFEDLGLVQPGAAPHSVLLVDGFDIAIEFPPRRVDRA